MEMKTSVQISPTLCSLKKKTFLAFQEKNYFFWHFFKEIIFYFLFFVRKRSFFWQKEYFSLGFLG